MHRWGFLKRSLVVLAMLLGACATLEQPSDPSRQAEFDLRGRIAYRYAGQGGSAVIAWRHAAGFDDLLVWDLARSPWNLLVEWPERVAGRLPRDHWTMLATPLPEGGHRFTLRRPG